MNENKPEEVNQDNCCSSGSCCSSASTETAGRRSGKWKLAVFVVIMLAAVTVAANSLRTKSTDQASPDTGACASCSSDTETISYDTVNTVEPASSDCCPAEPESGAGSDVDYKAGSLNPVAGEAPQQCPVFSGNGGQSKKAADDASSPTPTEE